MYKFSYQENVDKTSTTMELPLSLCKLCWFPYQYKIETETVLIKGYESWCGYYMGTVVSDCNEMNFKHCIEMTDNTREYTDVLFETKEEADEYIKNNLPEKEYHQQWVQVK